HRAAGDDESQSSRDDVGCLDSGPWQIPAVLRAVRVGTARLRAGAVRTCAVRRTVVRRTTAGIGRTVRAIGGAVTACRTVAAVRGTAIGSTAVGTTVITGGGIGVLGDSGSGLELVRKRQRVVVPPRPLGIRLQTHLDG